MTGTKHYSMSQRESITTTVRATPPKYQVTIPQEVREGLGFEGENALVELEVSLVKVLEEKEADS